MKQMNFLGKCYLIVLFGVVSFVATAQKIAVDKKAENMLLHQRGNGGWPKLPGGSVDYATDLSKPEAETLKKDKAKTDATIDNGITTSEIRYLIIAYTETKNTNYLKAAEKGVNYLLQAQYPSGGWSQYYPDSSGYRKHITYNDNAMVNVLTLLQDITLGKDSFGILDKSFVKKAQEAIDKGVACILATQVRDKDGILTVWCAQHDKDTFKPAKARAFELASLSGAESVNIVRFLMSLENPSVEVKKAIDSAIQWFEKSKIVGYRIEMTRDANGKPTDRVFIPDSSSTIWARFYSLDENRPIYVGRDSIVRYKLEEVEKERRIGYSYAGPWAQTLIEKQYPKWAKKWDKK